MKRILSGIHLRSAGALGLALAAGLFLSGCGPITPSPNPHNTGGAGITSHEGHSDRIQNASGTGNSPGANGAGAVPGSGAPGETDNAHSPSESNGGVPLPSSTR
jgi:hypothetical protein